MILTDKTFYSEFKSHLPANSAEMVKSFDLASKEFDLGYRIQASAVFSSNIEGNTLDLNSYMNLKNGKALKNINKEISEIDDSIEAYNFTRENPLNEHNLLKAHKLLSKNILIKSKRGKYRLESIGVYSESGLVYLAVEYQFVAEHMNQLFNQISEIVKSKQSIEEILYYASLIHLVFVHIHPFADGNGRAARLLEKWFITTMLGSNYWHLLSEKYYRDNQRQYYANINLGVNYYDLDYSRCIPFLLMLPESFMNPVPPPAAP
jgi:Fic family protein